ncbi:sensor histidine kinase [Granulicella aggregans]|uniref:sensor histidine kinase n=1 Tax=Granulicella aggregans TaxID=474949 RepID=UPI0021DF895B|nr:ATP-binding protein [Granulicella aggregans]
MQGIQSSMIPDKTEKRGLMSATTGPLEAAKRYLDRQRESEAALAAMDTEEADASLDDGRPAWLRCWRAESPHQTPETNSGTNPGTAPAMSTASGSIEKAVRSPADDIRHGDQARAANGYSGQSIEAAFAFETVFHFETELEADGTDDWLDLSGEGGQPEAFGTAQDFPDPAPDLELDKRETQFETAHREEANSSTEASVAGGPLLDPQAVRAAIFRLAHESSSRWAPPQELPELPGSGGARNGLPTRALTQLVATAETAISNPGTGFAEVARQLWSMPEAIDSTDQPLSSQRLSSQRLSAKKNPILEVDLTGPASGSKAGEDASAAQEVARETSVAAARETCPSEYARAERPGNGGLPLSSAGLSLSPRTEAAESKLNQGNLDQEWTLNRTLGEIRSEIRDEMRNETRFEAAEGGDVRITSLPEGLPAASTPSLRGANGTASDAPALAHDASNLLSALKLYSELLALSGVLHARHSHYAQDLKLLAARSEVLIDRLLASCSLAESDARQLVQNHVLGGTDDGANGGADDVSLGPADAPSGERFAEQAEGATPRSSMPSRTTESGSNQRDRFSSDEDPVTGGIGLVATSRLEPSLLQEPSQERKDRCLERVQALPEGAADGVPRVGNPEDGRLAPAAAQSPGKDSTARLGEAELSHAGIKQIGAKDIGDKAGTGSDPINLVDLLTRWGSLLSMIARGPVEVKFGPQAALPIQVGEEAMERILVNLVHNAMTATRNGGAIRIGVGRAETRRPAPSHPSSEGWVRPAGKMVLTVDDSGCGMSEEQIAKVLGTGRTMVDAKGIGAHSGTHGSLQDSLQSGIDVSPDINPVPKPGQDNARHPPLTGHSRSHRRHGMGLQIVRELVSASGGELAIYSRLGVGTRIEIHWPALQPSPTLQSSVEPETHSGRIPPASTGVTAAIPRPGVAGQRRPQQGLEGAIAC